MVLDDFWWKICHEICRMLWYAPGWTDERDTERRAWICPTSLSPALPKQPQAALMGMPILHQAPKGMPTQRECLFSRMMSIFKTTATTNSSIQNPDSLQWLRFLSSKLHSIESVLIKRYWPTHNQWLFSGGRKIFRWIQGCFVIERGLNRGAAAKNRVFTIHYM